MDSHKFDTLSKVLATGSSRRRVLGAVAGSLIAVVGGRQTTLAKRNNECAKLCKSLFGPGKDRGQCISAGARGKGPCAAPPVVTGTCQGAFVCDCVTATGNCTPTIPCVSDPVSGICSGTCTCA